MAKHLNSLQIQSTLDENLGTHGNTGFNDSDDDVREEGVPSSATIH